MLPSVASVPKNELSSGPAGSPAETGALLMSGDDVRQTLTRCCDCGTPAIIVAPDANGAFQARFARVADDAVEFEVLADSGTTFKVLSTCCVTFWREGRAHVFLTSVLEAPRADGPGLPTLALLFPRQIVGAEIRAALRVPVLEQTGARVHLDTGGGRMLEPRLVNVSLGGVLVEFPVGADPNLLVGDECHVSLRLREMNVRLKGEIRRHQGRQYGLFFPGVFKGGELAPPDAYRSIVALLEQLWVRQTRR